ncbi:unnamed protein product [Closterium sp. NIES-53]
MRLVGNFNTPPRAVFCSLRTSHAVEPVEVAVDSGAFGGAEPESAEPVGAGSGGAEPEREEPGGPASGSAEPERAKPGVAGSGGAEPAGAGPGGPSGALSRRELPSPQELCEWFARRWSRAAGAGGVAGAGGSAATGGTGAGGAAGAGAEGSAPAGGAGATGVGGACTGGTGAARPGGAPGAGATAAGAGGGAGAGDPAGAGAAGGTGAGAAGGTGACGAAGAGADAGGAGVVPASSGAAARPRPYFVPLLEQLASPLPAPSPYAGPSGGLAERREPESRPASPVRTARTSRRVPRPRPPAVPGTHQMALRPSTAPLRVPLPSPPESSLPALADPASDSLRAASPTVPHFLATVVTDPSFESAAASALVAELVDFAAHCRPDYAASLVAESACVCPPSVGGECALSTDVLEDRQEEFRCFAAALPHLVSTLLAPEGDPDAPDIPTPRSYEEAIEGPYSSQWQAAMDAEMASWKSTGTYVDEVPPPGANIVSGMWIFRVKRPPGSLPVFKARYVARGFSQRQGVDYFQTFSLTPKMTTLRVLLHVATQRDYELHSLDFSTAFLQGSLHEEIWLRRPPGFTGSFPPGTQWSLRRPVYGLRQAPREWHDTLWTTLATLGFASSTADPSLFLRTDTLLPPLYILVYVDDLVFATADTAGLAHVKSELQKRHTCTDLGELRSYLGLQITRDRARRTITLTQSHMVQQVLQRFDFTYSSPQATPMSTRHLLSALPSDESIEPSGPYPELVGCLMYLMTCTRPDLAYPLSILARYVAPGRHRPEHMAAAKRVLRYLCSTSGLGLVLGGRSPLVLTGHADAPWVDDLATQRSSQGYTFSLSSGSVSWRSTRSSFVLSSSCEAEIYAGAMAAQELRWLTYLLTDLGEPPRSPPVLYVDNKAMLALCREHILEHRTKHIALRYFLARELQQRGQLRLAYVASQANTTDIFTKALQPCDHQRFCTMLDHAGVGVSGKDLGGASSGGVGVGAEIVPVRGPGSGGAGVEDEPVPVGASCLHGAGVSRAVPRGATTEGAGAPATGHGESGTSRIAAGGADSGGGATGSLEGGPGATTAPLPSPSPPPSPSLPVYGPTFPPPDSAQALFPRSQPPLSPPLSHDWNSRSPRAPLTASLSTPVTDYYRAFRPVLSRVLASLVSDPHASLSSVSALTAAVTKFASTRRLDYATSLVPAPLTSPLAVGGPWASHWRAAMDSEMASYRSTHTCVDDVPPPGANVVDGMWIFRVKRAPGSPPVFKARCVARGFSRRERFDFFQTFAPTPKMITLRVLQRFELQHSTVQRTPLAVDHRLTGPFPDEPFEQSGPYAEFVGCLLYMMTYTRPDLAFPLSILARFVASGRYRSVHWIAAVRVAKYLATTSGVGLVLGGRQSAVLTGHSESSYADDAETQRSTQGYCFSLGSRAVS